MPPAPEPEPAAADTTGRYAWPAGRRLARDLAQLVACRDLAVCDIGCGTGILGLAALAEGARRVAFLDGDEQALSPLRAALAAEPRAACHRHDWGEAMPAAPWDLVLGGDILYREAFFAPLMQSLSLGLAADGLALLSDPRHRLEPILPELAQAAGLSWDSERRPDYTLVRLRRR